MAMNQEWEDLKKEARGLETELDGLLVSYSKFSTTFAQSSFLHHGRDVEAGVDDIPLLLNSTAMSGEVRGAEIEQKLERLSEVIEALSACMARQDSTNTTAHMGILQHHRGKLRDYTQEFRKTRAKIQATKEHAELISNVRQDINQYKNNGSTSRLDNALRERGALHNIDRTADDILSQASETRDQLMAQRGIIRGTISKLTGSASAFTDINHLMLLIRRRKSRDCIILGLFIAVCTCFLLWYWMRS